ncbi:MAG: CusA/CzcA family heavy metal efflux RND transporter [Gammaproteobacteria bacterium]|jgi:Cu(I)/Ag(I) efflux system membrane protein CusA/SilA|nr:CusA/CzcA family heavy metal efflux RND transporter [Chromatiales bacterium]MDP6673283.1 CusA/CzcA family heavy metal efflux RND transporter [Gammaproteobacteria bacterium]
MITRIMEACLNNRFLVITGTLLLIIAGLGTVATTPLDAIPDLSDVQIIIFTEYPGQAPQVVEDQVTYPLTTAMLSVPFAKVVRGFSFFSMSFVYIIFEDNTDMYWARSRVLEYLNFVSGRLPDNVNPSLGPDATGVGWIYEYALVDYSGQNDLAKLRSLQDWYLRYPLQTVPGVAEVASVGGYVKQYQVEVNPNMLVAYGIPLGKVRQAIERSNRDVGGRLIEMAETEYMVRGLGRIQSQADLESIAVGVDAYGTPIRLKDVANIQVGPELRRGLAELNGIGEVAGGIVIMRYGENALATIQRVRNKLEELKAGLPNGVEIIPVYDRGTLIESAVNNLTWTLFIEFVLVALICMVFLLHIRSALVTIIVLPIGVLAALIAMRVQGINANIMSLGGIAIAIGAMVDGPIVLTENAHKHLARMRTTLGRSLSVSERWEAISNAAREVGPALFFSLLVVVVSYFAIFTLEAQEGRLFKPLAYTSSYSMAAAAILAITIAPLLTGLLIRGRILAEQKNPLNRLLHALHSPVLKRLLRWPKVTLTSVFILLVLTWYPITQLGSEFMPPLDEGDILYMPTTFPGVSITKARELLQQTDKILHSFPEVASVFGKVGRAETATDPAPLSMIETIVRLKSRDQWPDPAKTTRTLMKEMDAAIKFPGLANAWTMPIKTRIDMLSTGIKTPVGIKIGGPDLNVLQQLAKQAEQAMKTLPETQSAFGDRAVGGYFLDFNIRRNEIARYGLTVDDVQDVIMSAIGGMQITETVEGLERYSVSLRYPRELRDDPERLGRVLVPTPSGAQIPLAQLADIQLARGAPVIKSENARPQAWVYVDIKTSDVGGFVTKARKILADTVDIPVGYTVTWSGQFEYMERAAARLRIVIPLTLFMIFLLLYLNFRNVAAPIVVMLSVPFGLIGGFWIVHWYDFNLSVAVAVGFIALAGVATETGVLVLTFIEEKVNEHRRQKEDAYQCGDMPTKFLTREEIIQAIHEGTSQRVRPVAMTATSTIVGLLPIMLSSGTGSDVMQRIAAPMVGGMLTTTFLCLLVLPVIYGLTLNWKESRLSAEAADPIDVANDPVE